MADTIEEFQAALAKSPGNWEIRSAVAKAQYDEEDFDAAAATILDAPELPADEEDVIFAASIIGAVDVDHAHEILDAFLETENSPAAHELKARLYVGIAEAHLAAAQSGGMVAEAEELAAPVVDEEPAAMAPSGSSPTAPPPLPAEIEDESLPAGDDSEHPTGEILVRLGDGDRSLIVAEGEAIQAQQKEKGSKEKILAITTAIMIHLVVGLLLALILIAAPRPKPPLIAISSLADGEENQLEETEVRKTSRKTASTVASAQPVISSEAFSNFSIPEVPVVSANLSMVSIPDAGNGFSMSMGTIGDISNMGGIPPSMQSRCSMSQRMKRLRESGGQDQAERAVRNGLKWLTSQQNKEDGSFGKKYKCAMTGLTLLAYLGHCETPESPKFGDSVVKAAMFLIDHSRKNDGRLAMNPSQHSWVYEHAIATYALCELYTMTKAGGKEIPRLESVIKKAVGIIVKGQTDLGGWAYGYNTSGKDDMSVAGWQIQALKAAYNTGRVYWGVEGALDNAMGYLKRIQDDAGAFKYNPDSGSGKQSLTGAALLGMQVWGEMDSGAYKRGMEYLSRRVGKNPPLGSYFYEPYYNTQAFFLHEGKEWKEYNRNFQSKLLGAQNADGSWTRPGSARHAPEDSHVMNTAWGCLMLEVYYRYLPTTEKLKGLKR